jgi:hypothetical protein
MLGGPVTGVWASISRRSNGVLEQMDRGGNPTINPFINPRPAQPLTVGRPRREMPAFGGSFSARSPVQGLRAAGDSAHHHAQSSA